MPILPILPMPIPRTPTTPMIATAPATDEAADEAVPTPMPAVEPERTYPVEIRLLNAATIYHVDWPASTVRSFLADELKKVAVPVHGVLGRGVLSATRYVLMAAVAEVIIHNWSDGDGAERGDAGKDG